MLLGAMSVLPAHAGAAGDANAAKGIVAEHCVACHEVPGYSSKAGAAELGAPPFATIANDPQHYDPKELENWLRRPHWPMQQFMLSDRDIDNLLAFIESLRKQ
jgi:mono/diheme cytochrome c family protein